MVHYELLGLVLGLAVANSVIIDVSFPLLAYSKLLNGGVSRYTLDHLQSVDPELEKNLRAVLSHDGDVADLGLEMVVAENNFGATTLVPLVEGGEGMAVDSHNAKLYVQRYIDYVLDSSVARPFEAFKRGFDKVVTGSQAMALLNDHELRLIVEGSTQREIHLSGLLFVLSFVFLFFLTR